MEAIRDSVVGDRAADKQTKMLAGGAQNVPDLPKIPPNMQGILASLLLSVLFYFTCICRVVHIYSPDTYTHGR